MMAGEDPQDWRPRPDPTVLTTEALQREIGHLRELVDHRFESHGQLDAEKFARIEQRFKDRELLVAAEFAASKEAVAAALASSKEAVAKSEDTFNKQITELRRTAEATGKGMEQLITDLKDRVTNIEAAKRGAERRSEGISNATAMGISVLILLISAVGVIAAIIATTGGG